ncbi:hypothetical protein D0Y65_020924 [Glycine soja]|uniref:Protein BPS1, chloroplastic n=1 Tax=Glycine soja TaxID=3848 RepID=A0A445JGH4_GLYSO|nr:hypothetical protein D0Y65_020924 [Glycine soja]
MSSTDNHCPSSQISSFVHSIYCLRLELVHSLEENQGSITQDSELEPFQKQVTDRFEDLSRVSDDELLSIDWMRKLMDAFICCHEEFRAILLNNKEQVLNSPMRALSEGQVQRARKALMDLALAMLNENGCKSVFTQRNRSFGRHNTSKDHRHHLIAHTGSNSWTVFRSWSAAKQLHSIASNLVPPRGNEIVSTSGLAIPVYTMNSVLLFVLWTLVAAIPSQDRGLNIELSFPLTDEQKMEADQRLKELSLVCGALRHGLDPLELQVREVFRKIMTCRAEGLDYLG